MNLLADSALKKANPKECMWEESREESETITVCAMLTETVIF